MGRKADAATVVPLCPAHHRALHQDGMATFEMAYRVDLRAMAAQVEQSWQVWCDDGWRGE
jgi:hypothetical protein